MENIDDEYINSGPLYVAQWALQLLQEDDTNYISDRFDSFVLISWISKLATVDELVHKSQWASNFILDALIKYENRVPTELLENYNNVVDSLKLQLEPYQ